jgi:tritrans,polycis-undecaprenyl-diphosphate synthase [geranylgeranyl-diphosphate specific]
MMLLSFVKNALLAPIYRLYQRRLDSLVKKGKVPVHAAFILDGNRRYATMHGFKRTLGHSLGADKVEELVMWCYDIGVQVVTLYAFSTENFRRPQEEIENIMNIATEHFEGILNNERIHEKGVRITHLGNESALPPKLKKAVRDAEEATKDYDAYYLNICMAYGSRDEIVAAVKKIARKAKQGEVDPDAISMETLRDHLFTSELPDPDIIVRTGGETRLSNFLLFQAAYAELFFTDVYLPAFRKIDLLRLIRDYQKRERRYGR